jgi:hypothetical protein
LILIACVVVGLFTASVFVISLLDRRTTTLVKHNGEDVKWLLCVSKGRFGFASIHVHPSEYARRKSAQVNPEELDEFGIVIAPPMIDLVKLNQDAHLWSVLWGTVVHYKTDDNRLGSMSVLSISIIPNFIVLFAAAAFVSLFQIRALKRLSRVRRNICWKCGYSREGAVSDCCPECGSAWQESLVR